uniref:PWWP domain-containing protein n=1 Tax=Anopheles triannulatus TaxID=58253 RepID=A0A2M4A827_9DIPT
MAAARHDSKKRKFIESNNQIQRAKPPFSVAAPMILPNSRKPANVLPSHPGPSVVRKLAAVLPRIQQSDQLLTAQMCSVGFKATSSTAPVAPVTSIVRKVVMADTDSILGARVNSPAKPKLSGTGSLNTIVSFAGSAPVCIPTLSLPSSAGGAEIECPLPAALLGVTKLAPADVRTLPGCGAQGRGTVSPKTSDSVSASVEDTCKTEARYNVAPGWRRVLRNQVIVYISPSEKMLYNLKQVREYLLSAGTCKCGLPCPFHPDVFFQFDCQVPNLMLETSKNGKTLCSHSFASSTVRSEAIHTAATATSPSGLTRKNPHLSAGVRNEISGANRNARSAILQKIPPWRKSVSPATLSNPVAVVNISAASVTQPTKLPVATTLSGTLSTTFVFNTQAKYQATQSKPLSISINENQNQTIDCSAKGKPESSATKKKSSEEKKVTFKDDPTGYLNQQTAMLHSSISILHSPDRRSPAMAIEGQNTAAHASSAHAATVSEATQSKTQQCRSKTANSIVPMALQTELPSTPFKSGAALISAQMDNDAQGIRLAPVVSSNRSSLSAVIDSVRRKCSQNSNISTAITTNEPTKSTIFVRSDERSAVSDPCSVAKQAKLNPARISESPSNRPFVKFVNTSLASCQQILPTTSITAKMPTSYPSTIQPVGAGSITSAGSHIVVIDQNSTVNADSNHFHITGYPVRQSQDQCYISAAKPQPQIAGYDINRNHVVSSDASVTPLMLNGTNIIVNNAAPSAQMLSSINGILSSETTIASSRQAGAGVKSSLMTNVTSGVNELSFALAAPGPACPPPAASMVMNPANSVNIAADTSNNGSACFTGAPIYSANDRSALSCFTPLLCKPAGSQAGIQNNASVTEDCAQDPLIRSNKVQAIKRAKANPTILSTYSSSNGNILLSSPSVEVQPQAHHPQPAAMQLQGPFVQVNPYASLQNIQLASSLAGITVVPASKTNTLGALGSSTQIVMGAAASNQQLHHHSQGQQPSYNLLGHSQTILLPTTGMIVASDATNSTATLLQVQNMSQCAGGATPVLTAPAGIVLRTQNMPTTHGKPTASFLPAITHQPFTLIAGNSVNSNSRHVSPGNVLQPSVFATSFNGGIRSGDSGNGGAYVGSAGTSLNVVGAKSITQIPQHVPLQIQPPIAMSGNPRKMDINATADTVVNAGTSIAEPVLLHCDTITRCHPVNSNSFSKFTASSAEVKVADNTTSMYIIKENGCAASIETSTPMNKCISNVESDESTASSPDTQKSKRNGLESYTVSLTIKEKCAMLDDNDNETNQNTPTLGGDTHLTYPLLLDGVSSLKEEPRAHNDALDRRPKQQPNETMSPGPGPGSSSQLDMNPHRTSDTAGVCNETESPPTCRFGVGDLVWGAVRGYPAWPGKVWPGPSAAGQKDKERLSLSSLPRQQPLPADYVWVRWFGIRRISAEKVAVATLKSLSEGLEAHHRAQKDARKSRKLNPQLEHAIQQAMLELDRASTVSTDTRNAVDADGERMASLAIDAKRFSTSKKQHKQRRPGRPGRPGRPCRPARHHRKGRVANERKLRH